MGPIETGVQDLGSTAAATSALAVGVALLGYWLAQDLYPELDLGDLTALFVAFAAIAGVAIHVLGL